MRSTSFSAGFTAMAIIALTVLAPTHATAQREKVLYNFAGYADGAGPSSVLIFDAAGNMYGTTEGGGGSGISYGTVFELSPASGGIWKKKTLHAFTVNDGHSPYAGLVADSAGNLYGTTSEGGTNGGGTVYELIHTAAGTWTEKILHNFGAGADGGMPAGALVFDSAGNLYGTAFEGGDDSCGAPFGCGVVYELVPTGSEGWAEKILYTFTGSEGDGIYPASKLLLDSAGDLYGVTRDGGSYNCGTAFELKLVAGGGWTERVLHSFNLNGIDGCVSETNLVFDAVGNLYGATLVGGANRYQCSDGNEGCGSVFELSPVAGGGWEERVLASFTDNGQDGYYPYSGLIFDASGNIYGTTSSGGDANGFFGGTVFELKPTAGGGWLQKTLYSFGSGSDAAYPQAGLVFGPSGALYGASVDGGPSGYGTVYEIKP